MALVVFSLLWVPTVGRAMQPLTGHTVTGTAQLNKSAVLQHDPIDSPSFIASPGLPMPAPPERSEPIVPGVDLHDTDRAHEGVGLRAPPASIL